jgi:segregation and condensation protein A
VAKAKASAPGKGSSAKKRAAAAPEARPVEAAAPESVRRVDESGSANEGIYRIQLPQFEGPLDLLLHLIQQHELDILDIPVGFITQKYLEYLNLMRSMSIDLASEYLVMAATLTHIKSKMLLPVVPAGQDGDGLPEEEEDPRAELVRRLLEYQKYKAAAADMAERSTLGKDIFPRGIPEPVPEGPAPFAQVGVFALFEAFEKLLKRSNIKIEHEVNFDRITITDRIVQLTERMSSKRRTTFEDLLLNDPARQGPPTRFDIVITFLALLEMAKMRMLRVYQSDPLAPIHLELTMQRDGEETDEEAGAEAEAGTAAGAEAGAEAGAGAGAGAEAGAEAAAGAAAETEAEALAELDEHPEHGEPPASELDEHPEHGEPPASELDEHPEHGEPPASELETHPEHGESSPSELDEHPEHGEPPASELETHPEHGEPPPSELETLPEHGEPSPSEPDVLPVGEETSSAPEAPLDPTDLPPAPAGAEEAPLALMIEDPSTPIAEEAPVQPAPEGDDGD